MEHNTGFSLRILVAGESYIVTGEYLERGSTSEYKIVTSYQTFARELCVVNGESSDLRCLMNTMQQQHTKMFFSENAHL